MPQGFLRPSIGTLSLPLNSTGQRKSQGSPDSTSGEILAGSTSCWDKLQSHIAKGMDVSKGGFWGILQSIYYSF